MSGDPSDFDPQTPWPQALWQGQPQEHEPMSLARTFEANVRWRNAREYIASVLVILGFSPVLLHRDSWMMQAGAALVMAATIFVAWRIHRRAGAKRVPEASETLRDFHRQELIRQRDLLRSVGLWYMAPFAPGMVLVMLGRWFQSHAAHRPIAQDHLGILLASAFAILVFAAVWWLNQRGADRLQRQIDAL
jgi:drug/metabolite transporter (DMT)-like permease